MRVLIAIAAAVAQASSSNDHWWNQPPWSWIFIAAIGAVIGGSVLVFILKRLAGRRRPHEVTLADFWWTRSSGQEVTDQDPVGPSGEYATHARIQVCGRRLEGTRNLTNLTLHEKARFWEFWRWGRWASGSTSLDLVGGDIAKIKKEGLPLGDSDSPTMEFTVCNKGREGRYRLSGRWRAVPWSGRRRGISERLKRIRLNTRS
ncbi:MAG: hypothetical protein ACRDI2_06800 [Chloroflexota bacterium]